MRGPSQSCVGHALGSASGAQSLVEQLALTRRNHAVLVTVLDQERRRLWRHVGNRARCSRQIWSFANRLPEVCAKEPLAVLPVTTARSGHVALQREKIRDTEPIDHRLNPARY